MLEHEKGLELGLPDTWFYSPRLAENESFQPYKSSLTKFTILGYIPHTRTTDAEQKDNPVAKGPFDVGPGEPVFFFDKDKPHYCRNVKAQLGGVVTD
jgi:hypothetical protein